ncbi:hypothetical protein [Kitasatospora camelliae]|uniref:Copper resistance protein D domain-containing protein n=1 Tax=Kitasatospora camelliae TaxID=3156397 RepID=A0AAU8K3G2_9ACTN
MPHLDPPAPLSGSAARSAAVSVGLAALWAACAWTGSHVQTDPALHTAALFVHLAALVVGFGAVLAIDYLGLLWMLGQRTLRQFVDLTAPLHVPVWAGLAGLTFSGILLEPNLDSGLTQVKLALVLLIALNGVHATALHRRFEDLDGTHPPQHLLVRGGVSAAISQLGWWGSVLIGFYNTQH